MLSVDGQVHFLLLQWGFIIGATVNLLVGGCTGPKECLLNPFLLGALPVGVLILVLEKFKSDDGAPQSLANSVIVYISHYISYYNTCITRNLGQVL